MSATAVLHCTCKHAYQDRLHGSGKRVHNAGQPAQKGAPQWYACTVCGAKRTGPAVAAGRESG